MQNKNSKIQNEKFFVVCPVGFEETIQNEIQKIQPWLLGHDARTTSQSVVIEDIRKGGVEISAPKLEAFQLVHHLKTPVRILWRWKSKKISHVSELKSYIRGLRPQDIFDGPLNLHIHSRKSRLNNEKMIQRVFHEDWKFLDEKSENYLYVDVYDDQFTFSWDLCGEPLYKRSWTPHKGAAPIRENLARLLLEDLTEGMTGPELAQSHLVDPMMGSGTFLWEALGWNRSIIERPFSYQQWKGIPGFLKTKWWTNLQLPESPVFKSLWGFDSNPEMVEKAKLNQKFFEPLQAQLHVQNVLQKPKVQVPENSLMISNPPYGERIATDSTENLIGAALKYHQPKKALFVWPEGFFPDYEGYKGERIREFSQGGIPVQVVVFSRLD